MLVLAGRGTAGAVVAAGALALWLPSRRRAGEERRQAARLARDLPRALDLLATCLAAGMPLGDAALVVCEVIDGPVRLALLPVGVAVRAGADPATAWSRLGPVDGATDAWHRLARAVVRASTTGAPLAATVMSVADDERERARWDAEAAARRAGVRAVGPLAACFLPAFVLVGVVPVVAGVAATVLGDLG